MEKHADTYVIPERAQGKWYTAVLKPGVQTFIVFVILFNSVILGLETSPSLMQSMGGLLGFLDGICLLIFVVEIGMKLLTLRGAFFKSSWDIFDFLIVAVSLLPGSGPFAIFRAFRVLRVLRLFTHLPKLRRLITSLLHSLPSIGWLMILLLIVFYVFSVLVTTLYGRAFPEFFGSMGGSMYTLFQILTLESWSMGVVRPVMEEFPNAYIVFIPFIIITSFIVLNAFIGILVTALQDVPEEIPGAPEDTAEKSAESKEEEAALLGREVERLAAQVSRLEQMLQSGAAPGDAAGNSKK